MDWLWFCLVVIGYQRIKYGCLWELRMAQDFGINKEKILSLQNKIIKDYEKIVFNI